MASRRLALHFPAGKMIWQSLQTHDYQHMIALQRCTGIFLQLLKIPASERTTFVLTPLLVVLNGGCQPFTPPLDVLPQMRRYRGQGHRFPLVERREEHPASP